MRLVRKTDYREYLPAFKKEIPSTPVRTAIEPEVGRIVGNVCANLIFNKTEALKLFRGIPEEEVKKALNKFYTSMTNLCLSLDYEE